MFRLGRRSRDTERQRESRRELSFVVSFVQNWKRFVCWSSSVVSSSVHTHTLTRAPLFDERAASSSRFFFRGGVGGVIRDELVCVAKSFFLSFFLAFCDKNEMMKKKMWNRDDIFFHFCILVP